VKVVKSEQGKVKWKVGYLAIAGSLAISFQEFFGVGIGGVAGKLTYH